MILYDFYLKAKKRSRSLPQFWLAVGLKVGQSGEATEKSLRNLSHEYQQIRQSNSQSGTDTRPLKLRGSAEVFRLFEDYYCLYFPDGGSAVTRVLFTENQMLE